MATAPPALAWTALAAVGLLAAGMAVGLQLDRLPLPAPLRRPALSRLQDQVTRLRGALLDRHSLAGLLHSVAVHLTTIAAVIAYARALGVAVGPLDALVVVPLTIFAAALPVSLNGWGVREGVMVAGLALYGVSAAEALLLSLMIGLSVTLTALPGGLFWFGLSGRRRNATPSESLQ